MTLVSLDVSTVFLQGYTFEEINQSGDMSRQECAFAAPDDSLFQLLAELDPATWGAVALEPWLYAVELLKGVYGLKDAPFLWFLRIDRFFKGPCKMRAARHDPLCYMQFSDTGLVLLISLHVDDIHGTSEDHTINNLHEMLESEFGEMTKHSNSFRHYGIDVHRDLATNHVLLDQRTYIKQLKPFVFPGKVDKLAIADKEQNTMFRSLVSAIAWAAITSPLANAIASLYQGFLPEVNCGQMVYSMKLCSISFQSTPLFASGMASMFQLQT